MKKRMWIQKRLFTLVEVIVSMAVFSILMLGLMQFFSSAQGLWTTTSNQVSSYEEARTATNMIAIDLMSAYYEEGRTIGSIADHRYFFIVQDPSRTFSPALNSSYRFKGLAFATMRPARAHQDAITRLTQVFYRKRGNHLEMLELADNIQDIVRDNSTLGWKWGVDKRDTAFSSVTDKAFPFYPLVHKVDSLPNDDTYIAKDNTFDGVWPSSSSAPAWSTIANNVVRFSVKVFRPNGGAMQFSDMFGGANVTKLPEMVILRLLTIDEQTAKEIKVLDPDCIYEDHLETIRNGRESDDVLADGSDETVNRIRELLRKNMVIVTRAVTLNHGI